MTIRTNITSIALVAAMAAGLASPAFSDEVINLNQYNLTRVEDVERLQQDIVRAASQECKAAYSGWVHLLINRCIKELVDDAVEQAQNRSLSNLHASIDADQRYDKRRGPASTQSVSAQ